MRADKKSRMCWEKHTYHTENEAIDGAIKSSRKFGPMRWYRCPVCGEWHVTSHTDDILEDYDA